LDGGSMSLAPSDPKAGNSFWVSELKRWTCNIGRHKCPQTLDVGVQTGSKVRERASHWYAYWWLYFCIKITKRSEQRPCWLRPFL